MNSSNTQKTKGVMLDYLINTLTHGGIGNDQQDLLWSGLQSLSTDTIRTMYNNLMNHNKPVKSKSITINFVDFNLDEINNNDNWFNNMGDFISCDGSLYQLARTFVHGPVSYGMIAQLSDRHE